MVNEQPIITMSTLGVNGRFGNQLLQYGFLKIYAKVYNLEVLTPKWIGQYLFGQNELHGIKNGWKIYGQHWIILYCILLVMTLTVYCRISKSLIQLRQGIYLMIFCLPCFTQIFLYYQRVMSWQFLIVLFRSQRACLMKNVNIFTGQI
ncbi:hypothetical protein [Neobacillus vireti]|uniref:hypothetical protein n=1 Tax=Neobacillus vireti TaxID=220686 RepID=UPI00300024F0